MKGKSQSAPFNSQGKNLADKSSVEAFDKKRYDFKEIVSKVENRKISSHTQTKQDTSSIVL
ncbi:hypothetical protein KHA80_00050 [Anaerobacillus sp. HL2]|nr:hypothetical protein KHA80_00050 [Anaerobacillus sp. HL2]